MTVEASAVLAGDSKSVNELRRLVGLVAHAEYNVALRGEPGSGFEELARSIHEESPRRSGPFVAINLGAIPANLATAELLGVVRGAYTGAGSRAGLIGSANGGTVFLEDVAQAPNDVQAVLLRVMTDRAIVPMGSTRAQNINVRFISAIVEKDAAVASAIRLDLLYRIRMLEIPIPPLRERRDDIEAIAAVVLRSICASTKRNVTLGKDALSALRRHDFQGNLRELESLLAQAALVASQDIIRAKDLPIPRRDRPQAEMASGELVSVRRELDITVRELEAFRARAITAEPIWQGRQFTIEKDYCFVMMPFADARNLQAVYRNHVHPVVERCGLRCERADDIYDISGVMQSVWEGINRARLIIADLTERNANVFYELGIAHTLGKPVIMITQHIDYVPFDLRHLRCVVYEYTPPGVMKLEDTLERTVRRTIALGDTPRIETVQQSPVGGAPNSR